MATAIAFPAHSKHAFCG